MHRRAAIRQAIAAALQGAGLTVSVGRVYPDDAVTLPGVNIVTGDEEVLEEQLTMNPNTLDQWVQTRALDMSIECRVAQAGADDAVDALALSVEQALGADVTLAGEVTKMEYAGSSAETAGDTEHPIALRTLEYACIYRVDARDPQALEA